ncbi:glycosyltransferase [uncultured Tateyamaria sp.]|uniref:glycosyltransferase family 2 protein n=1 Tax=uncultured Tateyamaria sp. TaxID=455651 RepID=UPI002639EB19|nr:glycosyltransferase [uncultured Tateyamaria sp.]
MTLPPVSVVVVSRGRPDALMRCLTGLAQVQFAPFEIVVVADAAGRDAVAELPFVDDLKVVSFDIPNISEARNLGISHAAGDVVAFIDDDAVPEPLWLAHLISPFARGDVAATGGFVRGRNGISFQWRARSVDETGAMQPLDVDPELATVLTPKGQRATKTEGTNMAVRREVLVALEGFDPGFAFYLDETDLNLRLARAGHATAIVPMAEVHHGFAPSVRRRADRVPRDLFDIGASWAVFQRKYVPEADRALHWRDIVAAQRKRCLGHMVAGRLLPGDVARLLKRLADGYADGLERQRGGAQVSRSAAAPFKAAFGRSRQSSVLSGRIWQGRRLRQEAVQRVERGEIVTLILLSPSALFHHIRFHRDGYWEQRGGLFGRSERTDPLFRLWRFSRRVARERRRIAGRRFEDG